jgi:P-type Ca2+ transporter type 2C
MEWHSSGIKEVLKGLDTDKKGLKQREIEKRLEQYGPNTIEIKSNFSPLKLFLSQFTDTLVVILIIAAIASYGIGFLPGNEPEITDSILILLIVLFNGIFGFIQDYKAEKSVEALKKMASPSALVLRNGVKKQLDAKYIVPGDIIILEEGARVPADARIIETIDMEADESMLTGESVPVSKSYNKTDAKTPLAERKNMLYAGTIITRGKGVAVVVETGLLTEMGSIADTLSKTEDKPTAFQKELDKTGRKIGIGILILIAFIAIFQFSVVGTDVKTTFLTAISLAVAAIPEGLPAVVTISLALGMRRLLKQKSLIRKMPVVETLGSVDVICTDKTGTLTENKMTVTDVYYNKTDYRIEEGVFYKGSKKISPYEIEDLLKCGLVCNDASFDGEKYIGDPTEIALLLSAAGLKGKIQDRKWEIPFSSERKMMSVAIEENNKIVSYTKGAPEIIVEKCSFLLINGRRTKMTDEHRKEILKMNEKMASNALRVLGFAYKTDSKKEDAEEDMVFLGLQGMMDPARKEVKGAIALCKKAGIRTVMITGDNKITAKAVASKIGLPSYVLEGKDVDALSDHQLEQVVKKTSIYARVSPQHKVRVLKALQTNGNRVAMTGDGVNDAPALKSSDVGVAMGIRGTDVAKQASQMVIIDDNFATIVAAVKEGRTVFDNIRKFVNYLLTSNFAEVFVVFAASLFGYLPVTAVQLLWINLLTDGFPALALGIDPAAPGIMDRKPREKREGVIDGKMIKLIAAIGIILTITILGVFFFSIQNGLALAQTMVFTSFVVYEIMRILVIRQNEKLGLFSNKWLLIALAASLALQLIVVYTPLNVFFGTVPLGMAEWGIILGFGIFAYIASMVYTKFVYNK